MEGNITYFLRNLDWSFDSQKRHRLVIDPAKLKQIREDLRWAGTLTSEWSGVRVSRQSFYRLLDAWYQITQILSSWNRKREAALKYPWQRANLKTKVYLLTISICPKLWLCIKKYTWGWSPGWTLIEYANRDWRGKRIGMEVVEFLLKFWFLTCAFERIGSEFLGADLRQHGQ